jgi:hypothetical protein
MIKGKIHLLSVFIGLIIIFPTLSGNVGEFTDVDPLVDLSLTIDIMKIRSLEHDDPQLNFQEIIDQTTDPDFYMIIYVNNQEYKSDIFWNTKYLYNNPYSIIVDVSDDIEQVDIRFQLWDAADEDISFDRLCDISIDPGTNDESYDAEIIYDLQTGHWTGDDELQDASGYGRLNGCDDGTIYQLDRDCELWFSITQNDYDHDGIPYYMESTIYGFDPLVDDTLLDHDEDGIASWWEWKYGYDPITWENHSRSDLDHDGLSTINEYRTSQWFSDPYTRDLFIEIDEMCEGPTCNASRIPERAKEMLYTAHDRQNVIYHLDDGSWEESGSEFIPFDQQTSYNELQLIYYNYFLHGDEKNWRKEIFHYGVVIYQSDWVEGYVFGANRFQISAGLLEEKIEDQGFDRDVTYASAFMHENGHTLDFHPIPGHNYYGWLLRIFLPLYKSCMSYGWIYRMVDYSDGSRPFLGSAIGDYDDWERMDLTHFLRGW